MSLRALSLHQPWASAWLSSIKRYETRHWETDYRGPLVVHAAKHIEVKGIDDQFRDMIEGVFGRNWAAELPRGALIGMVILEDCLPTDVAAATAAWSDCVAGNWASGRFAFRRSPTYRVFKNPVPWVGRQKWFSVPDSILIEGER